MPRTKAMSTVARELAKTYGPDQLRQLAELVSGEAEKPRMDKKEYTKLSRDVKNIYVRLYTAEERFTSLLSEAGKSNDEINAELSDIKRQAEREAVSAPSPARGTGRRGRRKASEATE